MTGDPAGVGTAQRLTPAGWSVALMFGFVLAFALPLALDGGGFILGRLLVIVIVIVIAVLTESTTISSTQSRRAKLVPASGTRAASA